MSSFSMTSAKMSFVAAAVLVMPLSSTSAEETFDCDGATKTFTASTAGQILSVTSAKGRCIVVFLMHREGKRPRRITVDLSAEANGYDAANGKRPARGQILPVRE